MNIAINTNMKISDLSLKLYHGSRKKFPDGFVLLPRKNGYASIQDDDIADTERMLEFHRPSNCLPRSKCVFMVSDPAEIDRAGGYDDYVYEVQPIGKVEKNDMHWYGLLASCIWDDAFDDPKATRLSKLYWSGEADKSGHSLMEFRAKSAIVKKMINNIEE